MKIEIIRKPVKYLRLRIKSSSGVEIVAPHRMPQNVINKFLIDKQKWIDKKLLAFNEKLDLGSNVEIPEKIKIKEYLITRINFWSAELNLPFNKLTLRTQKTRWGSCTSKRNISLNYKLFLIPPLVSDYVIIHELCHTKVMNHSQKFWDLVEKCCSHYKDARKYLKSVNL